MELEWDEENIYHLLLDPQRGLSIRLVQEIVDGAPKLFPNTPREGRTGSDLMVGPDATGRFYTIVLLHRRENRWRPITGWPSTAREIRLYRGHTE
jgi:hypothetical protein